MSKPSPLFRDMAPTKTLQAEAAKWLGTPFRENTAVRGAGVDCVHLCAALYIACGVIDRFAPPKYALDGGKHAARSLVLEWLEGSGRFYRCDYMETLPMSGDLLCFAFRRGVAWHVGTLVYENQTFIHASAGVGVVMQELHGSWLRRLAAVWRPLNGGGAA